MSVRDKKSQVTIFLILGVVMVIVVIALVFMRNYSVKKTLERETINAKEVVFDVQPIRNFVLGCLSIISKESLNEVLDGTPAEEQLESYVENNIDACLDFSVFEEQGFEILKKEVAVEVSIDEKDIAFKMAYPIIIGNPIGGEKTELKDFFVKHNIILEVT
jgi:hypothetical protein